jgi:hypothetical protein
MAYQLTSYIAFEEVLCTLGERQRLVLSAIKKIQPCSNLELSKYLNKPINTITPRCQELRSKNLVHLNKKDICKYTNRLVCYWSIPEWINGMLA